MVGGFQFNMQYTNTQLKQALAKMLPEILENYYQDTPLDNFLLSWTRSKREVLDTELLHLCWLVEETLTNNEADMYGLYINGIMNEAITQKFQSVCDWHATWQQRVIALAKVKGVEIV